MEKEGIEKRSTICYINRYYNLGMGWNDNQEIQSFQGIEERKFQGQYDKYWIDPEHACRSNYIQNFKGKGASYI